MDNHNSYYPDIGTQGESFVAQWLQQQSWQILAQRWRCRWGELDLIAYSPSGEISENPPNAGVSVDFIQSIKEPTLAFIEVKTRSKGNWDLDGRLAITAQKQIKLQRAAQVYLAEHPRWTQVSCRFDVALVGCKSISPQSQDPVLYQFHLQDYLMNAWD